jgi:hypothetical protein
VGKKFHKAEHRDKGEDQPENITIVEIMTHPVSGDLF